MFRDKHFSYDRIYDKSAKFCGAIINCWRFVLFSNSISYHKSILHHNHNVLRSILLYPEYRLRRHCVFTMYPLSLKGTLTGRSPLSTSVNVLCHPLWISPCVQKKILVKLNPQTYNSSRQIRGFWHIHTYTALLTYIPQITLIFYRYKDSIIII